jgi:hypothetical protein
MRNCPICGAEIPSERLLCAPHWRILPWKVKQEVWAAWDAYKRSDRTSDDLVALRTVQDQAIDVVRVKLGMAPAAQGISY